MQGEWRNNSGKRPENRTAEKMEFREYCYYMGCQDKILLYDAIKKRSDRDEFYVILHNCYDEMQEQRFSR